ncbi:MAG: phosphoenolpyruvate carboxykinase [Candidatus Marinimicrobia bacterium]|nr:phosphoenolpyruvate carboxykinase [Candidatus Neomarinimicrobiota bacterium]
MHSVKSKIRENKVILKLKSRVCESPFELLESDFFREVLWAYVVKLQNRESKMINIFKNGEPTDDQIDTMIRTFVYLFKLSADEVPAVVPGADQFTHDKKLLTHFVEGLYTHWINFDRFMIIDSTGDKLYERPYRTFDATMEGLMHLVRHTYRKILESVTGNHPKIYRQVHAGCEAGAIVKPLQIPNFNGKYAILNEVGMIHQMMVHPPLIFEPPMNKRRGKFLPVSVNPLDYVDIKPDEWFCFPAKINDVLVHTYVHEKFYELGFNIANLFELAEKEELDRQPDAIYLYGVPEGSLDEINKELPTVYYNDKEKDMLVAAVPRDDQYGYFGYLKKMMLTLHNTIKMKRGVMPFHGSFFQLGLKGNKKFNIMMMGDSGAGKSETLEALRLLGNEKIRDITIIADDMGSIQLEEDGSIKAYGTEIGAFLRLDDLQTGYAFEQIDRAIITNPSKINARITIPITDFDTISEGTRIDMLLYANNYEDVSDESQLISFFDTPEKAWQVFRDGAVMSKGTTETTGIVNVYFCNVFGPAQDPDRYDEITRKYFHLFFDKGIKLGTVRTRLGVRGNEKDGPLKAAKALLNYIEKL